MQDKQNSLELLSKAISTVGYWRWWTAKLPKAILLEFGGVQLYSRPTREDQPPAGVMALTFRKPKSICFLDYSRELEGNWSEQLQEDELDPFPLDRDKFAFDNDQLIGKMLQKALRVNTLHGYKPQRGQLPDAGIKLGFSAGAVGVCISAESMELRTHQGTLTLDQVAKANDKWWEYWKDYWRAKETDNPMPKDHACEATSPAAQSSAS